MERSRMEEFTGGRSLIYKSDNIYERRQRILREARKMIAQGGLEAVSVRDLCNRAGIAQKTLYNAFGSKENVIALAIRQYMVDFTQRAEMKFESATLEGWLERLIKTHSRNLQIRPYTSAIMGVYNSPTADRAIRNVIRSMAEQAAQPFADAIAAADDFLPGVTAESFIYLHTTAVYAILVDWCLGDVPDAALVDRICECFLLMVVGCTRGATHDEAQNWLEDLRAKRPSWSALRRMAEAGVVTDLEPGAVAARSAQDAAAPPAPPAKAARRKKTKAA